MLQIRHVRAKISSLYPFIFVSSIPQPAWFHGLGHDFVLDGGQSCNPAPILPGSAPGSDEQVLGSHPEYLDDDLNGDTADDAGLPDTLTPDNMIASEVQEVFISASVIEGDAPQSVDFSATAPEGQSLPEGTYAWDFGDGTIGESQQVNHV